MNPELDRETKYSYTAFFITAAWIMILSLVTFWTQHQVRQEKEDIKLLQQEAMANADEPCFVSMINQSGQNQTVVLRDNKGAEFYWAEVPANGVETVRLPLWAKHMVVIVPEQVDYMIRCDESVKEATK